MSGLFLGLLGPFFTSVDDGPSSEFQTQRTKALLVFLATERALGTDAHGREALMELLWDGLPLKSARVNLRQTLYLLRQAVDDVPVAGSDRDIPLLLTDRHRAQLNPDFPLRSDVAEFTRYVDGPRDGWAGAVDLYRGDFLADFYLADASGFEAWAASRRAAFRRQVLDVLDNLTAGRIAEGAFDEAEQWARRHLEIDDLRESAYRQLMQIYAWTGRQAEALRLYQRCQRILDAELNTAPDAATVELHEAIRENRLVPPPGADGVQAISGAPVETVAPSNPFRGLFAFREEDTDRFFGRESFTRRLLEAVEQHALVAVIGPSGSGKSSVLFAGLAARARKDRSRAIVAFRPGGDPFQALAAALLPLLEPEMSETDRLVEARKLAFALREDGLPLTDVLGRIVEKDPKYERTLLLADQFEELFTLCPSRDVRECFLDLLLEAVAAGDNGVAATVVLALRADFLGRALGYRPLADALQDADLKLGPMTREELARAIEKPAQLQGVEFADGLMERILDDVGREPGQLPLLQFALSALWEKQENGRLTHAAYEAIGRVQGAVARYAEAVYGQLSASEKERARNLLLQTIRPGVQTEDTRRLALRGELGVGEWALAQRLAGARLVVLGQDPAGRQTVELVHEALIHGWDRLQAWLEEARAFRAWQERLRAALRQWQASEQDAGALLRGVPLAEAEGWLREHTRRVSPEEAAFIEASARHRDARRTERQREREARERTRRRVTQGIAAGFVIALILALLAATQWWQALQARDRAEKATALQLAAVARNLAGEQLDVAALLSVEAYRQADTFESRNSLLTTLSESPQLIAFLPGHGADVRAVAFSPNGRRLATGDADGAILVWDTESAYPLGPPLTGHTIAVRSLAFSPDGQTLASSGVDDTIRIWDIAPGSDPGGTVQRGIYAREADRMERESFSTEAATNIVTVEVDSAAGLAFSADGSMLATAEGNHVVLRDAEAASGSLAQALGPRLDGAGAKVVSVAFSPEGDLLAAGDAEGTILFWDVASGEILRSIPEGHSGSIAALSFSPDGKLLASASSDGTARLWDVETARPAAPALEGHSDWVTGVAFAEGGRSLLSSGRDGRLLLWDISEIGEDGDIEQQPPNTLLDRYTGSVWSVATDAQGSVFASGGARSHAALWKLARIHPLARALNGHRAGFPVTGASFSPDGRTLASASRDGTVLLWAVEQDSPSFGRPLYEPLDVHSVWATFSPDGKVLASASRKHRIVLWDLSGDPEPLLELEGHEQLVTSAAFSPDGRLLASGSDDRTVILWDVNPSSTSYGRQLFSVGNLGFKCCQVIFSGDGDTLLVGYDVPPILRWDVSVLVQNGDLQGQKVPPLSGHTAIVDVLDVSPDGRTLVSASFDGTIRLWNLESGQQLGDPLPLETKVYSDQDLAFSPDGRMLALTAGQNPDRRIHLWDVGSRQGYATALTGHRNGVFSVDFSPDGSLLASTGFDPAQILLWDVNPESWAERACRLANRNLTREEWRRYFGEEAYRATCPALPVPGNE